MSDNLFREEISSSQNFLGAKEEERRDFILRIHALNVSQKKLTISFDSTKKTLNFLASLTEIQIIDILYKCNFKVMKPNKDSYLKKVIEILNQITNLIIFINKETTVSLYMEIFITVIEKTKKLISLLKQLNSLN